MLWFKPSEKAKEVRSCESKVRYDDMVVLSVCGCGAFVYLYAFFAVRVKRLLAKPADAVLVQEDQLPLTDGQVLDAAEFATWLRGLRSGLHDVDSPPTAPSRSPTCFSNSLTRESVVESCWRDP